MCSGDAEVVGMEESSTPTTMASEGFVSSERKESVVMVVDDEDDEASKDCWNHREASDSGDGEFKKMSKSGTHASIFAVEVEAMEIGVDKTAEKRGKIIK